MRAADTAGTDRSYFTALDERKPNGPLHKQRVRRNFLTWAFFLAQASAAELLLTGAAKAQAEEPSENPPTHSDPAFDALPADAVQGKFDVAEAAAINPSSSGTIAQNVTPSLDTTGQIHPQPLSAIAGHTPPDSAMVSAGAGAAGSVASQSHPGSSGNPNSSLPNLLPDTSGTEHTPLPPVTLDPPPPVMVDIGLTPVLGFDVTVGAGGLITANVGVDLNGVLGPLQSVGDLLVSPLQDVTHLLVGPVQDVTQLVDSLANDLGHLLSGDGLDLGGLLPSNQLHLSHLTGLTLSDGIAGLLGGHGEHASAGASSASEGAQHEPALAVVTSASHLATQTLLGSGGIIDIVGGLNHASTQHDDLYAQGRYTDYNVALRDGAEPHGGDVTPNSAAPLEALTAPDHHAPTDITFTDLLHHNDLITRPSI